MYSIETEGAMDNKIMSKTYVTVESETYESLQAELGALRRRVAELEPVVTHTEQVPFGLLVESVKNYEIIMLDSAGCVLSWNQGAERLKGYKAEEILGKHFSCFYLKEDIASGKPEQTLKQAADNDRCEIEGWRVRKDGSQFWANVVTTALRDKSGKLIGFSKLTRDYTDRKQMEQAQARLTAILEATTDFVGITDRQGRAIYLNKAGRRMLGISADEDISNINFGNYHPEWARKIILEEGMPGAISEGVWSGETAVTSHEGREIPVSQVIIAHKTPSGTLEYFSSIARDISDRKQAEAEIRKAMEKEKELNELRHRFVSMAYHELRIPLSTILTSSDLIKIFGSQFSEEKKLNHLNRIQVAVKRMTGLLDDTLLVGKAQAGRVEFVPSEFNLQACCRDVLEEISLTYGEKHTLTFECQGECSLVEMDEKLLRHMLANLLSNAVKYSPQGGKVSLTLNCENGKAIFQIRDSGIGIPASDRDVLFEVFHRGSNVANIPGTGLGMAIIKQAVDLHGGSITFESEEGMGTTFTIWMATRQFRGQIRCASPVEAVNV